LVGGGTGGTARHGAAGGRATDEAIDDTTVLRNGRRHRDLVSKNRR